ncbi:MAG: hypothetical protein RBR38_10330 [Desulfomicrobium apsheronum]|nr:hypothetical protein [Desulfomicrobium apsheronum]
MYGWESAPYANGLMAPWAAQSLPVTQQIVQDQVAPAMGMERGEGNFGGYSVPGDPSTATQTSQATKDRVMSSLSGSLGRNAKKTAATALAAYASGAPFGDAINATVGGLMSPGSIGGILGGGINAALNTTPSGILGNAINWGAPVVGGLIGGPFGALAGGMFGGVLADSIADGLDSRKEESLRDDMENKSGYFGGRTGYGDLQTYGNRVAELNAKVADVVNKAARVANFTNAPAPTFSPRSVSSRSMEVGMPGTQSYGGWGNIGGPDGGARAVDRSYGPSMGGFAGLGIGNPSSYGGGNGSAGRGSGGFGANDGNSDTAGNAGFGR